MELQPPESQGIKFRSINLILRTQTSTVNFLGPSDGGNDEMKASATYLFFEIYF